MASDTIHKSGILLVMFGTSVETGLAGLLHIRDRFVARFEQVPVKLCFSSRIIQHIWQERCADPQYRMAHQGVPEEILTVQKPKEALQQFHEEGINSLIVQSVQIAPTVHNQATADFSPGIDSTALELFDRVGAGRPALGLLENEKYPYPEDVNAVAASLLTDISRARQEKAALVYMGHGNKRDETDRVYRELVQEIRKMYPDVLTWMRMVEGGNPDKEIVAEMQEHNIAKALVKPFMIVAGDHVRKDMIGQGLHTLQSLLEGVDITVLPVAEGLGEQPGFADIFVQHTLDAAIDAGIGLG